MTTETGRKLYHNDMSTCAAKVRIVLAEKDLPWDSHHMNLRAGDTHRPEYLLLNPMGVVPTLIDAGKVLIESTVICEYLDDAYPEVPLRPAEPVRRARMRLWTKRLDDEMHAATGVVSNCIAFRHQHLEKTKSDRAAYLAAIRDPARRERLRLAIELGIDSPQFAPAIRQFRQLFGEMAEVLKEEPWLCGDRHSLADVAYTPYVARLEHLGLGALLAERPAVRGWADRVKSRDSYARAVSDWFNDSYLQIFDSQAPAAAARLEEVLNNS